MLHVRTYENAANRHRFVTPEAARPYLEQRQRANLTRRAREINKDIIRVMGWSQYGTASRQARAKILQLLTELLNKIELALASHPTPIEQRDAQTAAAAD